MNAWDAVSLMARPPTAGRLELESPAVQTRRNFLLSTDSAKFADFHLFYDSGGEGASHAFMYVFLVYTHICICTYAFAYL